jgi:hypothetical protein
MAPFPVKPLDFDGAEAISAFQFSAFQLFYFDETNS